MPGKKIAFRLYSNDGHALIDLLQRPDEGPPEVNKRVLCRHPFQVRSSRSISIGKYYFCFQESKRAWVIPSKVESLYTLWWSEGQVPTDYPSLAQIRQNVQNSLKTLRQDHKRSLNPTPYKVLIKVLFKAF